MSILLNTKCQICKKTDVQIISSNGLCACKPCHNTHYIQILDSVESWFGSKYISTLDPEAVIRDVLSYIVS